MKDDNILKKIRSMFVTGLLVIGPVFLTIWIAVNLFLFADGLLGKPIQFLLSDVIGINFFKENTVHGFGVIALITLIIAAGWLARQYLGDKVMGYVNKVLERIPLLNKIFIAITQISQAFLGGQQREVFKYAVMIEYPRKDMHCIGFVTQDTRGPAQDGIKSDVISVFVPTTPNPTSGFLLFVQKNDATYLDMSVEEALKLVISAGAVVPRGGGPREDAKKLGIKMSPFDMNNSE
jgi:uncharacterized membrane protein